VRPLTLSIALDTPVRRAIGARGRVELRALTPTPSSGEIMTVSLQSITDAWGRWFAQNHGTGLHWTESTNYGNHGELSGYMQYQVATAVQSIVFGGSSLPTNSSNVAYQMWYDNATTVPQTQTFDHTTSTTQDFTWSVSESLSVGVELSATAGVPDVAQVGSKVTTTLTVTGTQGATVSNTQTWGVNTAVTVPSNSSVQCSMVIATQSYNIPWSAQVTLTGYINVWLDDPIELPNSGTHRCWFFPIQQVIQDCINNKIIDVTGFTVVGGSVVTSASGSFQGSQGVNVSTQTKQYPCRVPAVAANAARMLDAPPVRMDTYYGQAQSVGVQ
jgi:hypothetical protein